MATSRSVRHSPVPVSPIITTLISEDESALVVAISRRVRMRAASADVYARLLWPSERVTERLKVYSPLSFLALNSFLSSSSNKRMMNANSKKKRKERYPLALDYAINRTASECLRLNSGKLKEEREREKRVGLSESVIL